eukprot:4404664-Prymnesium_polylepis.1
MGVPDSSAMCPRKANTVSPASNEKPAFEKHTTIADETTAIRRERAEARRYPKEDLADGGRPDVGLEQHGKVGRKEGRDARARAGQHGAPHKGVGERDGGDDRPAALDRRRLLDDAVDEEDVGARVGGGRPRLRRDERVANIECHVREQRAVELADEEGADHRSPAEADGGWAEPPRQLNVVALEDLPSRKLEGGERRGREREREYVRDQEGTAAIFV